MLFNKSQIDTENDKNPKLLHFSKVLCIHFQFLDKLRRLEHRKGSTRRELLSSRLFRNFFLHILLKFRHTSSIGMIERVNNEKIGTSSSL